MESRENLKVRKIIANVKGKNIQFEENRIVVPHSKCPSLYSLLRSDNSNNIAINICAIVGENGSGKSSIIDMIIRIINIC